MIIHVTLSDGRQSSTSEYQLLVHRRGLRQAHCSPGESDHRGKACHEHSLLLDRKKVIGARPRRAQTPCAKAAHLNGSLSLTPPNPNPQSALGSHGSHFSCLQIVDNIPIIHHLQGMLAGCLGKMTSRTP